MQTMSRTGVRAASNKAAGRGGGGFPPPPAPPLRPARTAMKSARLRGVATSTPKHPSRQAASLCPLQPEPGMAACAAAPTKLPTPPLEQVNDLTAVAKSERSIVVAWNAPSGTTCVDEYKYVVVKQVTKALTKGRTGGGGACSIPAAAKPGRAALPVTSPLMEARAQRHTLPHPPSTPDRAAAATRRASPCRAPACSRPCAPTP